MPTIPAGARRKAVLQQNVKRLNAQLVYEDILWLRRAATKAGAAQVPPEIAERLIAAGLIEVSTKPATLKITEKGRIALSKLG